MPISKAQQKSVNKYVKENYDRINVTFSKGQREIIRAYAKANSRSVNGFINAAVEAAMTGNATPQNEILVKPETMAKITEHIKGTDETPDAFIDRAVTDTIDRDMFTRRIAKK